MVRTRHAEFFIHVVEHAAVDYHGPREVAALTQLAREYDNIRAALGWLVERGDAERAVRLAAHLWWFWVGQQQWEEGRAWLDRVAALPCETRANPLRAEVLYGSAAMAWRHGDYATADRLLQDTIVAGQEAAHEVVVAWALVTQAQLAIWRDECPAARRLAEESLVLTRKVGDRWAEGRALETLSELLLREGDYGTARRLLDEAISLARATEDRWSLMRSLLVLGDVARSQGEHARAARLYTECLDVSREMYRTTVPGGYESLLHNLGYVALHKGDAESRPHMILMVA